MSTVYDTTAIQNIIERENMRSVIIIHDDFNRHETYCVATDDKRVISLVSVQNDVDVSIIEHENAIQAIAYIMSVAIATFASVSEDETQATTELQVAHALRTMTMNHLQYNIVDHKNCSFVTKSMFEAMKL
ncbi:hypothetical protein IB265_33125 [Ensifer sp. ENS10]|uniref:hypothetical protein n=1 Tax=Ensifer sp. ENS10 TaxID=2769286 RepID=UPI00177C0679|nr:hypothetical protein [Ensifer sp. ENS10]MBD9511601.1 hypothetical protein [Ensifer sp. ENS10]